MPTLEPILHLDDPPTRDQKGNVQSCDNWRDISLLDVVGKVMGFR